jgi:hypothetical protein
MGEERRSKPPAKAGRQTLRAAQVAALGYLPAKNILATFQTSSSFAMLENFGKINRIADAHTLPSALRMLDGISPKTPSHLFLGPAHTISLLNEIVANFGSHRTALDAIAAAQMAQYNVFGEQMRQILSAQDSIAKLLGELDYKPALIGLLNSVNRYGQVQTHLAELSIRHSNLDLLRGYTTLPGQRYDRYLQGLPARPIARRATVARQAGDAQSGLIIAESLTASDLGVDDREELAEHFTATVLEPWQTGPAQARNDLFAVLASLEPGLADWLKAAWDDIARDGPKAASKIANCTVECIDRALRAAASTDDVLMWLSTIPPKPSYLDKGRPTRSAKVMYIMRTCSKRDAALAEAQVESLASLIQALMNNFQSVKHGDAPSIAVMRGWVLATEGALSQLFLHV